MTRAKGTSVGPYEVVGWLGAGAMGEVYRARDARLGRDVAIKLIAPTLATDVDRIQRFAQEARAAGQLNHPNIVTVYDVGTHEGAPYVVSELLEGESLRVSLRHSALPFVKLVDYARQLADGLAAAHDKGVVHRDLKPDNVFVTSNGHIKILDFGLAKLSETTDAIADGSQAQYATEPGTVLGTTGYMSPEQLRGERVDHRSDIFSLGAILYELATGTPAFTRASGAETTAAILTESPASALQDIPPTLARIIVRCLEKSREARFQSARDLGFSLQNLSSDSVASLLPAPAGRTVAETSSRTTMAALSVAVVMLALALSLVLWAPWRHAVAVAPQRLSAELGGDVQLAALNVQFGSAFALSPDGQSLAFVARKSADDTPRIYLRRFDQLQALPLSGTENAVIPFFSPDSVWIGFFAEFKLKKVAVSGGAPITLADAFSQRGATWSGDGTIVFSPNGDSGTRLLRVSAAGGVAEPVTSLVDDEVIHLWPQVLPGAHQVLYTASRGTSAYNDADLIVQSLRDGTRKVVYRGGYHGRYLSSGHLVFVHDGTLFAAPFDLDRLEVAQPPVAAIDRIGSNAITGGAQFTVSDAGTLAYLPGPLTGSGIPLDWMNQAGQTSPLLPTPANWFNPRFAPDGLRIAMNINDDSSDIWVYDWSRGTLTRVTTEPSLDTTPVWTADGLRLAFASNRGDGATPNLYWQRADGGGTPGRLTVSAHHQAPASWHSGGGFLAFEETTPQTSVDVMILPLDGDEVSGWKPGKAYAFANTPAIEAGPAFSPDGRWLAYTSNESGRGEVYVRPFPGPGARTQVSAGGGTPVWSPTNREIFYGLNGQIMSARFTIDDNGFRAEKPVLWSTARYRTRGPRRMFDLHPDGRRFALAPAEEAEHGRQDKVILIFNFFAELQRIASPKR